MMKPSDIIEWWDFIRQRILGVLGARNFIVIFSFVSIVAAVWYWPQITSGTCVRFPELTLCPNAQIISAKKQAALNVGYNILLWSALRRAGVHTEGASWDEQGVTELHFLEADVKAEVRVLELSLDFPPVKTLTQDDYVYKFLEYDSELRGHLGVDNGELLPLYQFGFALGTATLQLVTVQADPSSDKTSEELIHVLDDVLAHARSSNLPNNLIEEITRIQKQLIVTGLTAESAQLYASQLKQIKSTAETIVSR